MHIRLAENFRAVFYAPYYAAQALGFFAQEGVEIEFRNSSVPGDAVKALLDGDVDITWGGPMRVMKARDQDASSPLVCFCEVVARDPFFLVGRGDRAAFALTDLPRLRFATVSEVPTPWMCLQHDLREHGIDPDGLARVADRPMGENLSRLGSGELDVVQLFEPFVSMALQQRAGDILYAASARGPTVYTAFIASRDGMARNRAAFAAMTRAMARMQHWLAGHGGEELADVTATFFPDVASDLLASSLARYHADGIWSRSPEMSPQGFAQLADSLVSGGFISRPPVYRDCVDVSLSAVT
jgi:NitT/TauT family transport system substrate-binding protein